MKPDSVENLTERVLRYQRTGAGGPEIVRDVARRVYEYPRRKCRWDEDSAGDFFVRVYPKIQGLIERFRYKGRPFESYLKSTLMFQIRSFAQQRRKTELEWVASACPALGADTAEPAILEILRPEPDGSWTALDAPLREALGIAEDGRIRSPGARKCFLILCLKCAHLMSDGDVDAVARIAKVPVPELGAMMERLRDRQRRKLERVELFTGRRNRAYAGLRLIELRLAREPEPEKRAVLEGRSTRMAATVRGCQRVIAMIQTAPSHREIGQVLGLPKPTVDSIMHRLKQRAARLYARRHAEYA